MTLNEQAHPLRAGSLFTGTMALDMAASAVVGPTELAWVSDIKPAARTLLAHHQPDVPNIGDITTLDPESIPQIDLLTAGWPCQPFSAAGLRLGEADPRALWPHVHRIIAATRPQIFFGENVGRVSTTGELRRVVRSLAEVGYVGAWRCVRASDVGAPHRRERLFLLAVNARNPDAIELLKRVGRPLDGGTLGDGDVAGQTRKELSLLPTPTARHGDPRRGSPSPEVGQRRLDSGRRNLEDSVAAHLIPLLPTPTIGDVRNSRNATAGRAPENDRHNPGWTLSDVAYASRWGKYAEAINCWARLHGPAPDPAVPNLKTGQLQLSPVFVEWMMGLPEGHVTGPEIGLTRAHQLSMLGDGVVPQQGAYAYTRLVGDLLASLDEEAA